MRGHRPHPAGEDVPASRSNANIAARYRRYVSSHDITQKAHLVRQMRGRKAHRFCPGPTYDLGSRFRGSEHPVLSRIAGSSADDLEPERARTIWDTTIPRTMPLSSAASSTIHASPVLPSSTSSITRCCISKHPVKLRGSRRCVHSAEFQAEEKLFPQLGLRQSYFCEHL